MKTEIAIDGTRFLINGKPTYAGVSHRGKPVEGLLLNSRMIQAIFDAVNRQCGATLQRRGGGGYSAITFSIVQAIVNDTGAELTANVPNCGCVVGIDDDAVVEVVCRIDKNGAHPLPVGPIPLAFRGIVQALKAYETLTVEAAVHRDRRLATLALLNHPLVGDIDVIEPLLTEMLTAHGLEYT